MKVSDWTGEDVVRWLGDQGLQEYCDALRSLNGRALLELGPSDFASPPLSRVTSDGGQQLLERVQTLRLEHHIRAHKNVHNGHATSNGVKANGTPGLSVKGDTGVTNGNGPPKHKTQPAQRNGVRNGALVGNGFADDRHHGGNAWIQIPLPAAGATDSSSRSPLPEEWGRTGVAVLYAVTCFVLTTVMISVVHERVPPKEDTPPLPDKFFDWFDRKEWAFMVCEVIGLLLLALWLVNWALHKHRSIVGRRFFFIIGTLYLYRCVTMYITTLPVPGMHFRCAPKVMGDHMSQAGRVFKMIAGGGLTITGSHHMCGDYLYSGHTVILTLCYLFIKEYSPRRFWWCHWLCWLLWAVGLFCILLAHDHYSIDVVVAYYVTTQLFWLYHTMANQQMGYAVPQQTAAGIHTRLFSRAFIVDDGHKRVVFITADIGMVSQRLRLEVLKALQVKYGTLYRQDNVVLSGTHTHGGPAGYFQYTLFIITSKGYVKPAVKALVDGIVQSVDIAHRSIRPGRIYMSQGTLEDSSLNRSPQSYLNNPQKERDRYETNTDKQVVVLRLTDLDGDGVGMLSWFAVHAVSMNYTNQMISSDNMGYAAYLLEQDKNRGSLPGKGPFVAGFSSSNLGDVSPNTRGPVCANTGLPCDYLNSSCPIGGTKMCQAYGPGEDMFESTRLIGHNIYKKAKELYGKADWEVTGFLHAAHQWVNMTDVTVQINSTHTARTCKPALGHSFAAGTTDGGGDLNFTQGAVEGDPFWDGIRNALVGEPSNETQECHRPKPILFSTGEMSWPVPWHPEIVDVQIITIGSVAVVAVPGEMTTMSGRRIREAIKQELDSGSSFEDTTVVIAGLSNTYTHYITTYEEYQIQRYEGASTIYGPHTLGAYLQKYTNLARAIAQGTESELQRGPEPPYFAKLPNLLPAAPVDKKPVNSSFGQVLEQVLPVYRVGDVVSVTFVAGNPRHSGDIRDKTFVTVEVFLNTSSSWEVVHTDASWETRFHWVKGSNRESNATVEWHIPASAQQGSYRIQHFGHYKKMVGFRPLITAYQGSSDVFAVSHTYYY